MGDYQVDNCFGLEGFFGFFCLAKMTCLQNTYSCAFFQCYGDSMYYIWLLHGMLFCGYENGFCCVPSFYYVLRICMHMCLTVDLIFYFKFCLA